MGIIIDTNVLIDAEQGRIDLAKVSSLKKYKEVFISAITVAELLTGVHMAKNADERIKRSAFVEHIIKKIPSLPFDDAVAKTYSELYTYFLKSRKSSPATHDLQISATAISHGYAILTSNTVDFKKIPGLEILLP
ncbi:MAG: type II toxin-antitoxin system VapC family toxin [Gammaproteobacteria bacterium]